MMMMMELFLLLRWIHLFVCLREKGLRKKMGWRKSIIMLLLSWYVGGMSMILFTSIWIRHSHTHSHYTGREPCAANRTSNSLIEHERTLLFRVRIASWCKIHLIRLWLIFALRFFVDWFLVRWLVDWRFFSTIRLAEGLLTVHSIPSRGMREKLLLVVHSQSCKICVYVCKICDRLRW